MLRELQIVRVRQYLSVEPTSVNGALQAFRKREDLQRSSSCLLEEPYAP